MARRSAFLLATVAVAAWIAWTASHTGWADLPAVVTPKPGPTPGGPPAAVRHAPREDSAETVAGPSKDMLAARFRERRGCYFAHEQAAMWDRIYQACQDIPPSSGAVRQAACLAGIRSHKAEIDRAHSTLTACAPGMSDGRHFYEATREAARAGDAEAQDCYVQSFFDADDGTEMRYTIHDVDDYRRDAPRYIANGLERGDWHIVDSLATYYVDGGGLLPLLVQNDPRKRYVMNRLLQLGAGAPYAHELELSIQAEFLSPGFDGLPLLTPQQIADGDRKARALYQRYFAGQPPLERKPVGCPQ